MLCINKKIKELACKLTIKEVYCEKAYSFRNALIRVRMQNIAYLFMDALLLRWIRSVYFKLINYLIHFANFYCRKATVTDKGIRVQAQVLHFFISSCPLMVS